MTVRNMRPQITLGLLAVVMCVMQRPTLAMSGGYGYFTDGQYCSRDMTFHYVVIGAPPNVCGELHIRRNGGGDEVTPGWICTDGSGNASKGPYQADRDEIATDIFIRWPDGSSTVGDTFHVKDITDPLVDISFAGNFSLSGPSQFYGTAYDSTYGSGFGPWTSVRAIYRNATTGLYWNGSSYSSSSPVSFSCGFGTGPAFIMSWGCDPPPISPSTAYQWSVTVNDRFYSTTATASF